MFLKRFKNLYYFKYYFSKNKLLIFILIFVMLVASSAGVFLSYLMSKQLLGITNEDVGVAVTFTVYILAVVTVHHVNWFFWSKLQFKLSKKVSYDIKKDFIKSFLNTKYAKIRDNGLGYYLERLNDDIDELSQFVGNVAGTLVDVFTNFAFLVIIYILSWQCGLFFTIGVIVLFVIETIKVNLSLKDLEKVKKSSESANSVFNEIVRGIKDIKGLGIKSVTCEKIMNSEDDLLEKVCDKNTRFELISRIGTYCQWLIDGILVFMSMLWLLPSGQIDVVTLLIIFNYKGLMYDTVGFFSKLKTYYVNGDYYAKRLLEIVDNKNFESFGMKDKNIKHGSICINNLSFSYGNQLVLSNVSIKIKPNTLNVIIGNSGCGKSTLLSILAKLYSVDNGFVFYDGIDINDFNEKSFKKNVCLVNQDLFLFEDTIMNNITIANSNIEKEEVIKVCKLLNIHDEIMALPNGYETVICENGSNLSGGQRQRIILARAILKDSKILLLDEPTSFLDAENQKNLLNTLSVLKSSKTILIIAHRLQDYKMFDNVFVLKNKNIQVAKHE